MRTTQNTSPQLRRIVLAASLALVVCLSAAGSASAFSISEDSTAPWPFTTITYFDESAFPASVSQAVRSWNRGDNGYKFQRVSNRDDANVLFLTTDRTSRACTGSTIHGYNFAQGFVILNGRCDRYVMTLAAAHELGHLQTLEHEGDECAVMNARSYANRRVPRLARPAECTRGRQYWRSPVRSDDRRGGNAARRRPFSFPVALCYDSDGSFQSQLTADEPLCNFQYDCRNAQGTAPNSTTSDEFLISRGCVRQAFDPNRVDRSSKARMSAKALHGHAFGESPGVEHFGHSR